MTIMEALYRNEINFSVESFWDGGYDVYLGDYMNGFAASTNVKTWSEVEEWLKVESARHFPDADFTEV